MPAIVVEELWVYPVKACQGIRVKQATLTATGLEHDRAWCVVDEDGINVSQFEAVSGRKIPGLARISVAFSPDGSELHLDAKGMNQLALPVSIAAYQNMEDIMVECSGKSTTASPGVDSGWSLGHIASKRHKAGSEWITAYLNAADDDDTSDRGDREKLLRSGKTRASRYALCRSLVHGLKLSDYPPIFPIIHKGNVLKLPGYVERFEGNSRRFNDFAPLLLLNKASALDLGKLCSGGKAEDPALGRYQGSYPCSAFRGNLVVAGDCAEPWDEENWAEVAISDGSGQSSNQVKIKLSYIKACPRCTVPCREQDGRQPRSLVSQFFFPGDSLRMWKVLKAAFPTKYNDEEWGSWSGAFFGIYFGNNGVEGAIICEGDVVEVTKRRPWDAHLTKGKDRWQWRLLAAGVAAAAVAAVLWQWRKKD